MHKNKRNFWLDLVLLALLASTTVTGIIIHVHDGGNSPLHIVFGAVMTVALIPHLGFHKEWLKAVLFKPGKPKSGRTRANAIIDRVLFTLLVALVVTGIVGEGHFHMALGILFVLTIGVHQLLHVKWIVRNTQRYLFGNTGRAQETTKSSSYTTTP
ncbi:MAG: hypothetical protein JXB38_11705 [Anaerolineales bacterium]|nr:hypothetical protein [Anaerolineales bacterium]